MTEGEQLARFGIFGRLTDAQRAAVATTASLVDYADGALLHDEGKPASGCWIVESGQVSLEMSIPGRGQVVVQTLGTGDVLGWSWLVPPHFWYVAARANGRVTTWRLDTERLRAMADDDPSLGYPLALGMLDGVVNRLQTTRARLLDLYGSPRGR